FSAEVARASRRIRSRDAALTEPARTLSATSRCSFSSCARYTNPIAPAPTSVSITYEPRREPGSSVTEPDKLVSRWSIARVSDDRDLHQGLRSRHCGARDHRQEAR